MLKYGREKFSPHHMNSILVEVWDEFKMSAGNTIRDRFSKTKLPHLRHPDLTTNIQACDASIQVSFGYKAEEINNISCQIVVPIKLQVIRTEDPTVVL